MISVTLRFGVIVAIVTMLAAAALAQPPRTQCVSVWWQNDLPGAGGSHGALSADGRFVVFTNDSGNVARFDYNGLRDVFVRDRRLGRTALVSVDSMGYSSNGTSGWSPPRNSISDDGRWVVFESEGSNLAPGDTNGTQDVFVHNTFTGVTSRVSVDSSGNQANGWSGGPSISADGRYVVFTSSASNLVPLDTNANSDIFLHDLLTGSTTLVSVSSAGVQGNGASGFASISRAGRRVSFDSAATNLVAADTNGASDVFVRDLVTLETTRVSVSNDGAQANDYSAWSHISADGEHVAFTSAASNLTVSDTNGVADVFVRDLDARRTVLVSLSSHGQQANAACGSPSITADGGVIAFDSAASNLVDGDNNGRYDVFVHDRTTGETTRVSVNSVGREADDDSGYLWGLSIAAGGRYVGFGSEANNLVKDDYGLVDAFVRERYGSGDVGFAITVQPDVAIGTTLQVCMATPAAYRVFLLVSAGEGPTPTPFGTLWLDLPPVLVFAAVMPPYGAHCFQTMLPCDPQLVGATGFLQFIAFHPVTGESALSNQTSVTVVTGSCH